VRIAITGKPGCGKTTLCMRIFQRLKDEFKISGVVTREVREKGKRIGFLFHDLSTGEEIWLAHVENPSQTRVGKYGVYVENISIISNRLKHRDAEVMIVDEIGPMELKSFDFVRAIEELLDGKKTLIFTIHLKSKHPLLERIRREFRVFYIDEKNRDAVLEDIIAALRRENEGKRG
jgi:nucleoside-triphosphatase